jgi:ribose transport system permease protein
MIAAPATPNRATRAWRDLSTDTALIYGVLALVALISWGLILANGGQINLANTLVRSVALGMVAVGQTLVILGGSLDLSVAYQVSVTAVMASPSVSPTD